MITNFGVIADKEGRIKGIKLIKDLELDKELELNKLKIIDRPLNNSLYVCSISKFGHTLFLI